MTSKNQNFISLCIASLPQSEADLQHLSAAAFTLNKITDYFEIILISPTQKELDTNLNQCLNTIPNLRLLRTRQQIDIYAQRVILAEEAIGDVVILSHFNELPALDLGKIAQDVVTQNALVLTQYKNKPFLDFLFKYLGILSGFYVSLRHGNTFAISRTQLNSILEQSCEMLALRFAPRFLALNIVHHPIGATKNYRYHKPMVQRLELIYQIAINTSPALLRLVVFLSALVTLISILYICYVFIIFYTKDTVVEGWLGTSIVNGFTSFFLAITLMVTSLTLNKFLLLSQPRTSFLFDEINKNTLFEQNADKINVMSTHTKS